MDSGTTLLRLPQKVFDAVVEAVVRTSLVSAPGHGPRPGGAASCADGRPPRMAKGVRSCS